MRRRELLVVLALAFVPALAQASAPRFVRDRTYHGTTSQHYVIQIRVSRNGRTATVVAGMHARCTGPSHYAFMFIAHFQHNPARVRGSKMSVTEVDRDVPRIRRIPAARVLRQYFAANAVGNGRTLAGTYLARATLTDGRLCTTGRVHFSARVH